MSDQPTGDEPASFVTADEAKAAIMRCVDHSPPTGENDGYAAVHVFTAQTIDGGRTEVGTWFHVENALNMVDQAHEGFDDGDGVPPQLQCAYVESKYGRCLHVFLGDGRLLKFDSVVPE